MSQETTKTLKNNAGRMLKDQCYRTWLWDFHKKNPLKAKEPEKHEDVTRDRKVLDVIKSN